MSITDAQTVDAIGIDKESGSVVLTISDHLEWEDVNSHLAALQEKLNTYLAFIESGEIIETYPDAKDRQVVIQVSYQHALPQAGIDFLDAAKKIVDSAGFTLQSKHLK